MAQALSDVEPAVAAFTVRLDKPWNAPVRFSASARRSGSQNQRTENLKLRISQSDFVASAARTLMRTSSSPGTGVPQRGWLGAGGMLMVVPWPT